MNDIFFNKKIGKDTILCVSVCAIKEMYFGKRFAL
jgi:hypothetical protein